MYIKYIHIILNIYKHNQVLVSKEYVINEGASGK